MPKVKWKPGTGLQMTFAKGNWRGAPRVVPGLVQ